MFFNFLYLFFFVTTKQNKSVILHELNKVHVNKNHLGYDERYVHYYTDANNTDITKIRRYLYIVKEIQRLKKPTFDVIHDIHPFRIKHGLISDW